MNNKQEKQLEAKLKNQIFYAGIDRDLDEAQLQRVCSQVADWILRAQIGDVHDLGGAIAKDIPDFILHKELRDRFDQAWTHYVENRVVVEKVNKEKRAEYENADTSQKKR